MNLHFLIPEDQAAAAGDLARLVVGKTYPYWLGGDFNWAAQSWLVLRHYRGGLTIGTAPKAGAVNFAHANYWRRLGARLGEFRVGARADYPRLFDLDFEILQNPARRRSPRQAYLPYWPVPGLIPRDPSRRGISTIAYAGRLGNRNLAGALKNGASRLGALDGLAFVLVPSHRWHDMSGIDLLVAIRSFGRDTHPGKPPSKLFNAWLAGVPLIAGWDNAYSSVGRPGVEYIRVESDTELRDAVARLRRDPAFYTSIVEAGRAKAAEVTPEKIAEQWLAVLEGPVRRAYETWLDQDGAPHQRGLARCADLTRNAASAVKSALFRRGASS